MTEKEVLIRLNEELENYFRNTIIPQLFVDADLILRKFTPPAMTQFDLSPDDLGRSIHDVVDNFRFPSIIENIQRVIHSNEILEKEIQTTDRRWYQMNILPYRRRDDDIIDGVIITFVNITRRINDLKDLEKLIADYEIVLDSLSHDIKGPLSNLKLAINVYKEQGPATPGDFNEFIDVLEGSLTKVNNIIDELLESRKQEYKYRSHTELLNIEHIMEDVRLTLNEEILKSEAEIKTDFQIAEVSFSRRSLRSIIYNLLNNAIKYKSPERKPQITVKTFRDNGYIVISVRDNGRGIAPEEQNSVFEKYVRAKNPEHGSGIGLYLVKEMVENKGGKVQLESQPGEGTEVKLFIRNNHNNHHNNN